MEFPFGPHHTHHRHHHRNDQEDEQPPPPPYHSAPPPPQPPYYQENQFGEPPPPRFPPGPPPPAYYQETEFAPPPPRPPQPAYHQEPGYPPPSSAHVSHVHHASTDPDFSSSLNYQHQPPPPPPTVATHVSHISHEVKVDDQFAPAPQTETTHHHFKPHLPSFLHHHSSSGTGSALSCLSNKPTVRVFCRADPNLSLAIRDNKVILASSDSSDEFQHWYKDEKYSTRVKDEESFPSFALVNKATGLAMKHSIGDTQPVQLIPYNPDVLDESVLWTESRDTGDGFRAIRMVNNIRLNVDAFHGDKKSGGVRDGTTIVLWQWKKGDNQKWKIIPYCMFFINQRN